MKIVLFQLYIKNLAGFWRKEKWVYLYSPDRRNPVNSGHTPIFFPLGACSHQPLVASGHPPLIMGIPKRYPAIAGEGRKKKDRPFADAYLNLCLLNTFKSSAPAVSILQKSNKAVKLKSGKEISVLWMFSGYLYPKNFGCFAQPWIALCAIYP